MTESESSAEEIAAAEAYEGLHVPSLFSRWAPRVAEAAQLQPGQRVLDVACGTGVLARHVAVRLGQHDLVTGVDVNGGMLAVANGLAPAITWRQAPAESLPFDDASFDAVVSQFGLMFFEDRAAAVAEMLRVLVPGGRLTVAVWESLDHSQAYPEEVALLARLAGDAAADALRAPFALGDVTELETLFAASGATSVTVTTGHEDAEFPSIRTMVEADLRGWLPVMGVNLPEDLMEAILTEAESVLGQYVTPDGAVRFDSPAHIVTGTKRA